MDIKNLFNIKNFYLKEAIEESSNIKYKTSSFFMLIYNIHYKNDKLDKSEDKILKESINDYLNIFKEIIEKLESKEPLYEISNIELIVKETLNPEFDWDKEMNLINQEFSGLNKKDYLLHNFKNDFIFFIEQFQFVDLIRGIIKFIEYNYKSNENKETNCFNNLRTIYNSIIENKINEENINEFINLLKTNEYYFNNENILIQFYKTLLEKKESLAFLNKIKDTILNINDNQSQYLNSNEISNLINAYIFFKNILKNNEIKTDKDFINLYNKEKEKNNSILINFRELIKKYFYFTEVKTDKIKENQINNIQQENVILNNIITSNNDDIGVNPFIIQFNYNSELITIQGNLNEKMKDIINKFITKTTTDKNSLCFLYGGSVIREESILSQIVTGEDKRRNQMNILVNSFLNNHQNEMNSIIKSKEVICPKCLEEIKLKIKNYKISLYECKNGHNIDDIYFKDFLNTQNIDLKKIICNNCNQRNKYDSYNKQFYTCCTCSKNLCPLCQSSHEKSHYIIDYDKTNSICKEHFESYYSYCKNCKKNLCMKCEKDHSNHEKIYYGNILPDSNEIKERTDELNKYVNQLNKSIEDIIEKLNNLKENINNFYGIYTDIIQNVDNKNRNYELLNNIFEITNNDIIKDIKTIVEEKNIKNKFNLILEISDKIEIPNKDEITLIYKINNDDKRIKLFDSEFIENNKNLCKIAYNNEEIELKEYIEVDPKDEKLMIKLKGINKIINASKMFYECPNLESIPDIIKWDLSKVTEKNDMFKGCNESLIIPNLLNAK